MKRFLIFVLMLSALCGVSRAGEIDGAEVRRLGDVVQYISDTHRDDGTDAFIEAMRPPESDADKWFISVISTRGCVPCAKLKQAWRSDPWLLALADPEDPKDSWAHYTEYDEGDQSQDWRFENLHHHAIPTIVAQPPRSGRYGDPTKVVFQGNYNGIPRDLAGQIVATIKKYVTKVAPDVQIVPTGDHGQDCGPPWKPTPDKDPDK